MELEEIMKAFAAETGIEGIAVADDGAYHFDIDGISVMFATNDEKTQIGMYAEIGEPASEGREIVYHAVLEAMAPGEYADGNVFSILRGSDRIVLSRADPMALTDYAVFKARLENLVNVAEDWRRNIANFPALYGKIQSAVNAAKETAREFSQSGFMQV